MVKIKKSCKIVLLKVCSVILIILLSVHTSCYQDIIEIDLSEAGPEIVINGILTDWEGNDPNYVSFNKFRINRPSNYYTGGIDPPVSGALVTLSDDADNSEVLEELPDDPGIYRASTIEGIPGREYTLNVFVDNKEYSAVSTMPLPLDVDSVWYERESDGDYIIHCQFTDRVDIKDHCRFLVYRYYSPESSENMFPGELLLYYDREENDGEKITYEFDDIYLNEGDYLEIQVWTIDENMYQYYSTLKSLISNDSVQGEYEEGPDTDSIIFPVTNFNPTTNMSNNALGYFSAFAFRSYSFIIDH